MKRIYVILIILTGIIILDIIAYNLSYSIYDKLRWNIIESNKSQQFSEMKRVREEINLLFQTAENDIALLRDLVSMELSTFNNFDNPASLKGIERYFLNFAKSHVQYQQIQFIGAEGIEKIRLFRNSDNNTINSESVFRNVGESSFFKKAAALDDDRIYSTPIDLVAEKRTGEVEYYPSIRFATKVRDRKDIFTGVVSLNFNPQPFFERIDNPKIFILDEEGRYITFWDDSKLFLPSGIDLTKSEGLCPICEENFYILKAGHHEHPVYVAIYTYQSEISKVINQARTRQIILISLIFVLSTGIIIGLSFFYQKQDAKKLIEQNQRLSAIGRISNVIAHDLKGPLTIIRGISEMRLEELAESSERKSIAEDFRMIQSAGGEQLAMIQEILDFSRGKDIKLNIENFDLKDYITERIENNSGYLKKIEISTHFDYSGVAALDKMRFNRVIDNILRNAGEALANYRLDGIKTGKIDIATRKLNGMVEISISDNGPGIPRELRKSLFTIGATAGKSKGTGLGLYSSRMITELHGGEINFITSEEGTTFRITLPLKSKIKGTN